jgi:WD40 repeat protein
MAEFYQPKAIPTAHKDLVHDVAYDYYGRRMATCSSDQNVEVWDLDESTKEWKCSANWKAHSGSIWHIAWAYPEFGQVLATCSYDRTVIIWEEQGDDSTNTHWVKRAALVDSRTSVNDVRFSPRHLGLQLATCSADGHLRIYEAPDVMNLTQWSLLHDVSCKAGSCLSWNPSLVHPPMIAVGSDEPNAMSAVQLFEYQESSRKWNKLQNLSGVYGPVRDIAFAPNPGRSYHLLAVAAKELFIIQLIPSNEGGDSSQATKLDVRTPGQFEDHGAQVWRVAWNATGTVLSSSGEDGRVHLWKANYMDNWSCFDTLTPPSVKHTSQSQLPVTNTGPQIKPSSQPFSFESSILRSDSASGGYSK